MVINVTQDHINRGHRASPCYCPIALAMKDAGLTEVSIPGPHATFRGFYQKHRFSRVPMIVHKVLPDNARQFIDQFDSGEPVEPFSFTISPVENSREALYAQ